MDDKNNLELHFQPVELTDDDLRAFGMSEEEIVEWNEFFSDPANNEHWNDPETQKLARTMQAIFEEFDV